MLEPVGSWEEAEIEEAAVLEEVNRVRTFQDANPSTLATFGCVEQNSKTYSHPFCTTIRH
eukprot:scaffold65811_cov43-Cyclotella_meneghiniana.AAC.4